MNTVSKLVALVVVAAGAAVISSAAPSRAQADRQLQFQEATLARPPCCQPATKQIVTGPTGWTVKPPAGPTFSPAVVVTPPNGSWSTLPGSQWIANASDAGGGNKPGGTYIYEYHLGCLCNVPKGLQMPVSLTLHIFADDDFVARVNGVQFASHSGGYGFNTPPGGTPGGTIGVPGGTLATTTFMPACDNILTIEVPNWNGLAPGSTYSPPGSPTGLDVYGSISGYFLDVPAGRCPRCPQRGYGGPARSTR